MTKFESVWTRVQIHGPEMPAIVGSPYDLARFGKPRLWTWLGKIGDPQFGPFYLGYVGWGSVICGTIAICIIGFNFWASVDWSLYRFITGMPWHQLSPPGPEWGRDPFVPLSEGGWWLAAGFFLTTAILLWWCRIHWRARALGAGTHVSWAFASAIFLYLSIGFFRPLIIGNWSEAPPFGIIPHLNWTATVSVLYGNWFYNPFHCFAIVFLYGSVLLFAMHGGTILAVSRYGGSREPEEIVFRGTAAERASLFWRWCIGFNATFESIHRWAFWFATLTTFTGAIGVLLTGTVVDNWYLWGVKWGLAPHYAPAYDAMPVPAPIAPAVLQ